MTTRSDTRTLLTEGVLLAAASAFIYAITFVYEYGYCRYFGIPASLISPNASTFLVAGFALGVTLLPALNFLAFTTPLFKAARDPRHRAFRDVYASLAILSAAGVLLGAIYGVSLRGFVMYIGGSAAFLSFLFLPALLSNRNLPISERLAKHADVQDRDPFAATNLFEGWATRRHLQLGTLGLIALLVANLIGDAEARNKRHFLALKSDPGFVLLRNYGDLMILGKLGELQPADDVRLMRLNDTKELDFVFRNIATLKPSGISQSVSRQPTATAPPSEAQATQK